eukprot:gene17607-5362_t
MFGSKAAMHQMVLDVAEDCATAITADAEAFGTYRGIMSNLHRRYSD